MSARNLPGKVPAFYIRFRELLQLNKIVPVNSGNPYLYSKIQKLKRSSKYRIPRQLLLQDQPVQLISLNEYVHDLSAVAHRHDHYTIMWITKGQGQQLIDGTAYEMLTNRVFFLHPGQIHVMKDFQREGWLLIFDETIYKLFLRFHLAEELNGIMQLVGGKPYVDLDGPVGHIFTQITGLISFEIAKPVQDQRILAHYIAVLLISTNKLAEKERLKEFNNPNDVKILIRNIEQLIELNFRNERSAGFYADKLHMQARTLNEIVKKQLGFTLHGLIKERQLTESKILLAASSFTIKEISYRLGFKDPSYFNRFFKKSVFITPADFRKKVK